MSSDDVLDALPAGAFFLGILFLLLSTQDQYRYLRPIGIVTATFIFGFYLGVDVTRRGPCHPSQCSFPDIQDGGSSSGLLGGAASYFDTPLPFGGMQSSAGSVLLS
jgi:hypothetical protein